VYGDNGVYDVQVCASDDDETTCEVISLTIDNVAPAVALSSDAPADEGSAVTVSGTVTDPGWLDPLSATIDWKDGSPVETVSGTYENTPPDATLTFSASHVYGDNGVYDVQVCASDDEETTCEVISLRIDNVAPKVVYDSGQVTQIDEGEVLSVRAYFTDPGWLDTYTSKIDWGWGAPTPGTLTVESEGPPVDKGVVTGNFQYGDNGTFQVTVSVSDDDGGVGADVLDLTVNNLDPTAEIDMTGAVTINGIPTFYAHAGELLDFSGRSTDPGSDDLSLSWDWDDGAPSPDVTTEYLVNPPAHDPLPSPTVQPRDVDDTQPHAFSGACLYDIGFLAEDDDGGQAGDGAAVIIVGNAGYARSAGYWLKQYRSVGKSFFESPTLTCYLDIVNYMSRVFSEETDAASIQAAKNVLFPKKNDSMLEIFDRQLLAVWLNFANGAIGLYEPVDTDGDELPDAGFAEVVTHAEAVRLDPASSAEDVEFQKNILERINNRDEI
jgi:hypothetical protein